MNKQQPSSEGARYHSDLARMHRMEPIDFANIEKLLERNQERTGEEYPPVQHFGVLGTADIAKSYGILGSLSATEKNPTSPRSMPDKSVGESETRSGDLLGGNEGIFLPQSAVQRNPGGGLSINLAEMATYRDKPKSQPSGHHRINPRLGTMGRFDHNTANVAQPPKSTWQKFVGKLAAAWRALTTRNK